MNKTIRIIKRSDQISNQAEPAKLQRPTRQHSREVAATIQLWISEFKERRRTEEQASRSLRMSLLNSMG